jgi:hypothetical protein
MEEDENSAVEQGQTVEHMQAGLKPYGGMKVEKESLWAANARGMGAATKGGSFSKNG